MDNQTLFLDRDKPMCVKEDLHGIYRCPVCGGSVWQNQVESKFCFRCGQKLDWPFHIFDIKK